MNWLSQLVAVSTLNIRTIPQRLGSSVGALIGIARVVLAFRAVRRGLTTEHRH